MSNALSPANNQFRQDGDTMSHLTNLEKALADTQEELAKTCEELRQQHIKHNTMAHMVTAMWKVVAVVAQKADEEDITSAAAKMAATASALAYFNEWCHYPPNQSNQPDNWLVAGPMTTGMLYSSVTGQPISYITVPIDQASLRKIRI